MRASCVDLVALPTSTAMASTMELPTTTLTAEAGGGPPSSPERTPLSLPGQPTVGQPMATTEPWHKVACGHHEPSLTYGGPTGTAGLACFGERGLKGASASGRSLVGHSLASPRSIVTFKWSWADCSASWKSVSGRDQLRSFMRWLKSASERMAGSPSGSRAGSEYQPQTR